MVLHEEMTNKYIEKIYITMHGVISIKSGKHVYVVKDIKLWLISVGYDLIVILLVRELL